MLLKPQRQSGRRIDGINTPSDVNAPDDVKHDKAGAKAAKGRHPRGGVVSGEFATGNGLTLATAPMMLNLFPAGANLTSIGEGRLWGYVCNPMTLLRRGSGTEAMVATLKRPHPPWGASRGQTQDRSSGLPGAAMRLACR